MQKKKKKCRYSVLAVTARQLYSIKNRKYNLLGFTYLSTAMSLVSQQMWLKVKLKALMTTVRMIQLKQNKSLYKYPFI